MYILFHRFSEKWSLVIRLPDWYFTLLFFRRTSNHRFLLWSQGTTVFVGVWFCVRPYMFLAFRFGVDGKVVYFGSNIEIIRWVFGIFSCLVGGFMRKHGCRHTWVRHLIWLLSMQEINELLNFFDVVLNVVFISL